MRTFTTVLLAFAMGCSVESASDAADDDDDGAGLGDDAPGIDSDDSDASDSDTDEPVAAASVDGQWVGPCTLVATGAKLGVQAAALELAMFEDDGEVDSYGLLDLDYGDGSIFRIFFAGTGEFFADDAEVALTLRDDDGVPLSLAGTVADDVLSANLAIEYSGTTPYGDPYEYVYDIVECDLELQP